MASILDSLRMERKKEWASWNTAIMTSMKENGKKVEEREQGFNITTMEICTWGSLKTIKSMAKEHCIIQMEAMSSENMRTTKKVVR